MMKTFSRRKPKTFLGFLFILSILTLIAGVSLGPSKINFFLTWKIVFAKLFRIPLSEEIQNNTISIIWNLRLPRVLLGFVVGAGLSLSGVSIQAFTKNPLSEPYILGVSSGASAGAVFVALNGMLIGPLGQFALPTGAFLGALTALLLVYILGYSKEGLLPMRLIFLGIAISSLFMAVTNFIVASAPNESGIKTAVFWMMGSLAGVKWSYLPIPVIVLLLSFIILFILNRTMNAMLLGDSTAIILGMNLKRTRMILVFVSALLAGSIVAVSGSISFIGLIAPHIVRNHFGADHKYVIPGAIFLGGIHIVLADILARLVIAPQELPIGIVTSFLGAPFFIYLLKKNKYEFGGSR